MAVVVIGLLWWVYRELRSPAVMEARVAAGQSARPPWRAFGAGAMLVIGLAVFWVPLMNGSAAHKAEQLAMQRYGSAYKYQISGMEVSDDQYQATVTAYNRTEIKTLHVHWTDQPTR